MSDHSGVYLTLHLDNKKKDSLWRLNPSLMNDKVCKEFIRKELKEYLLNNDNGGKRIAFSAYRKKVKQKHLLELQAKMKDLEIQHSTHKNPQVLT